MTKPAAIAGRFSDFKIIKTRSVAQLVVEVDISQADAALAALGGIPQPGADRPVALALMVDEPKPASASPMKSIQAKERYANKDEMAKAVTRAALLCKDREFQQFMGGPIGDNEAAKVRLCAQIGIFSRSAIGENPDAYRAFLNLEDQYRTQQQVAGYGEAPWTVRQ